MWREFTGQARYLGRQALLLTLLCYPAALASSSLPSTYRSEGVFVENQGQWHDQVRFRSVAGDRVIWVCRDRIVYQHIRPKTAAPRAIPGETRAPWEEDDVSVEQLVTSAVFESANPGARFEPHEPVPYKANFFIGNDPSAWRTDVPAYRSVRIADLYQGIDLIMEAGGRFEYRLDAVADTNAVRLTYQGIDGFVRDAAGRLSAQTAWGELGGVICTPSEADGDKSEPITEFSSQSSRTVTAMQVTLDYSTYLGGALTDNSYAIATDNSGAIYLTGSTVSTDFPVQNPYDGTFNSSTDVFVTKIAPDGATLVYSTYLGSTSGETAYGLTVDNAGNAFITGFTASLSFPVLAGYTMMYQGGPNDAFIAALAPAGNALVFSTYLGGGHDDKGYAIVLDALGRPHIIGATRSANFPVLNAYDNSFNGTTTYDAFVTRLSALGNSLVYSTYLGGGLNEGGFDIAVDPSFQVFVTGYTESSDFPTQNAYDGTFNGLPYDVFVTKLAASGDTLRYSTYLGGTTSDKGTSIAVDVSGNAYVTGGTNSAGFPIVNAYDATYNGGTFDAFVTKLTSAGMVDYSTYLGGADFDNGISLAVDGGAVWLAGTTFSNDFPTQDPYDPSWNGGPADLFLSRLSSSGTTLDYSTYIGGTAADETTALAFSGSALCLTGTTLSNDFPLLDPFDNSRSGTDLFVTRFKTGCCSPAGKVRGDASTSGGTMPEGDGATDGSDLGVYVDYIFFGDDSSFRLDCAEVTDINADLVTDGGDLGILVDYIFFGDTSVIKRCDGSAF